MSDQALATTSPAHPDKRRETAARLTPRQRKAVDCMIWEGMHYTDAAVAAGLTARAMRLALSRPHVMAYLRSEREVLRSSHGPRNIHRLAEIRDAADNMPAVNAIKALEQLGDETHQTRGAQHAPGFVIVIQQQPTLVAPERDITPKPLIQHASIGHAEPEDD